MNLELETWNLNLLIQKAASRHRDAAFSFE